MYHWGRVTGEVRVTEDRSTRKSPVDPRSHNCVDLSTRDVTTRVFQGWVRLLVSVLLVSGYRYWGQWESPEGFRRHICSKDDSLWSDQTTTTKGPPVVSVSRPLCRLEVQCVVHPPSSLILKEGIWSRNRLGV